MNNIVGSTYQTKSVLFKIYQFIWYLVYVAEILLGIRILFRLFGANPLSPFVSFLYAISNIFVTPFRNIFPIPAQDGFVLDTPAFVAFLLYPLGAYLIIHLLQLAKPTSQEEVKSLDHTELPGP